MAHKPEELQEVLHYTFKNPALLRIALTHTSYANESKVATTHNERLEFLGDSVLSVVVADYLFHQSGRPEGELKRMMDSEEVGGAPLLGAAKPVIKAHGSSHAKGIKNAIRQAKLCVANDLCGTMEKALAEVAAQKEEADA